MAPFTLPLAQYAILRELPLDVGDIEHGISLAAPTDDRVPRRFLLEYQGVPRACQPILEEAFNNVDHRFGGGELSFTAPDGSVITARTTDRLPITLREGQLDASVEVVELLSRD